MSKNDTVIVMFWLFTESGRWQSSRWPRYLSQPWLPSFQGIHKI